MVKVSPPVKEAVTVGTTIQFHADAPVDWTVAGNGTINMNGLYTAKVAGKDSVVATPKDGSAAFTIPVSVK